MSRLDLAITNAYVITMDPHRRVLEQGHVGIAGGRFVAVGDGPLADDVTAARIIDARGGVCHPGFIDTHAHVGWGLFRCAVSEHYSEEEIFRLVDEPILNGITDEQEHLGTLLSATEMLMNGTTCFADTGSALRDLAPMAEAVEAAGIRGMISTLNADRVEGVPALSLAPDECLRRVEEGLQRHPLADGLAWACAGLFGLEGTSDELVRDAKALADRAGVPLNLHKSFSAEDVEACRRRLGGLDPLQGFEQLGVLDRNLLLVHFNHCSSAEADLLESTCCSVSHCPTASMMYALGGSRHGRVHELLDRGVAVALGTDSTHWGNAWDLSRSVYLAATLHKEASGIRPAVSAERALEMATLHGAEAVGRVGELGSLELGKRADLVVHGVGRPEAHPRLDPVAALVYSGQSRTVEHVIVDGEQVVEDGRPTRIDLDDLLARVDGATREVRALLGDLRRPWGATGS